WGIGWLLHGIDNRTSQAVCEPNLICIPGTAMRIAIGRVRKNLLAKICAAVAQKIRGQYSAPRITQPLIVFLPHQASRFGPRMPIMQAVPGAARTVSPAQGLDDRQLL